MTIVKARARAESALGANFNIRAFHDTVLELGSVPLPLLDTRASIASSPTAARVPVPTSSKRRQ